MTDRRRFLSLMGIGAASAPLAAKELADNSMLNLAIRGEEATPIAPSTSPGWHVHPESLEDRKKLAHWLSLGNKLPEEIDRKIRDESSYISQLDPDIACKRSWSMCVKIAEQRQRNYDRKLAKYRNGGSTREAAEGIFKNITGFEWPW